ncbi:hypothetical protein SAMN02745164_01126 [Marinitoga hydrogenitolerans DSM 16785]|uniref:PNPLA domain-containing protein n=1 Tax=Marinitoga hydrogenitolerans (strain DSM 16785 / JCM 12826 / AT1271) TaxID=1122195 RepID=A0A1M4WAI7_MARH1|nr:hypothetical protein [Marinitoga hydrogenitolerans]SHE78093.1 hypothetical protein SAMN02745164_01126 [Marinitoga hydrogenitolerans DSM 16785]
MRTIKIASGDFKYGVYWNSGVISEFMNHNIPIFLKASGSSVLLIFFISKYKNNFFGKMIEFIKNSKILDRYFFKDSIYENLYNQALALWRLNRKKQFEFESHKELEKEFKNYFGNIKIKDLGNFFQIETYDILKKEIYNFSPDELYINALLSSFSSPPFFKYFEYNEKKLIPTAEISLCPLEIKNIDIVTSLECSLKLPIPKNGAEILLYSFFLRKKKLFDIITKDTDVLTPLKPASLSLSGASYNNAKKTAKLWIEKNLEVLE